jgi:hypothetical protein
MLDHAAQCRACTGKQGLSSPQHMRPLGLPRNWVEFEATNTIGYYSVEKRANIAYLI